MAKSKTVKLIIEIDETNVALFNLRKGIKWVTWDELTQDEKVKVRNTLYTLFDKFDMALEKE